MSYNPAVIANEALQAAGSDFIIGDLQEGTDIARMVLLKYGQCRNQLLRSVHWDFARQMSPLEILADATGQTAGVSTIVQPPWIYAYSYPINCMKARFLPANMQNPQGAPSGNIALPNVPLTSVSQPPYGYGMRLIPARFLISLATDYPVDLRTNWEEMHGASPAGRIVILTNVKQAQLVFTAAMPYPQMWDSQFRAAFVAYLASEIALGVNKDKLVGAKLRAENIAIARQKVDAARVTNGNESGFPQTTDHVPDWMRARQAGAWGWGGAGAWNAGMGPWGLNGCGFNGVGCIGYGWDTSVF